MAKVADRWHKTVDGKKAQTDRYGKGKRWEARWRDPDGSQRKKSFDRQIDAQRFLTTVEADMLKGAYVDPKAGRVLFGDFAIKWVASQTVDDKTVEGLRSHLRAHLLPTFRDMELRSIRPSTVQQWLAKASRELAPSYVRLLLTTLSAILGAAVEDDVIAKNPCRSRSVQPPPMAPRRVVPWTVEQVRATVEALPHRYRAPVVVAAGCGLRQGEAFGLPVGDIDFLRKRVEVRQQVKHVTGQGIVFCPPKRGKTRTIPLPETVAVSISEHLATYPAEHDALAFTNTKGGPINKGSFNNRIWKAAVIAAGLEPNRHNGMHALRHHYASVLLDAGVSIRALAEYLGHSDPGFTLRVYTHLMPESEDRARQAIDAAFSRAPSVTQAADR